MRRVAHSLAPLRVAKRRDRFSLASDELSSIFDFRFCYLPTHGVGSGALLEVGASTDFPLRACATFTGGAGSAFPTGTAFTYDAENHLTSTAGVTYTYDGDGKRIMKSSGTLYWYGMNSDPLMETGLNNGIQYGYFFFNGQRVARISGANEVNHFFTDALGSTRAMFDWEAGNWNDSDFYPFGAERVVQAANPSHFKFTGKERDSESGLDNFGLRYDSSSLGRFMSPDSIANDWELRNPQTWNRYAYARNNPLIYIDPDGAAVELICMGNTECEAQRKKALEALQQAVANKDAASRLYINEVKDGDNTRYFVGIKGDVGDFENLSSGAKDLGDLVGAKQVVEFGVTDKDLPGNGAGQGAYTYKPGEIGNANPRVLVNPQAVANDDAKFQTIPMLRWKFGDGILHDLTTGIAAWHEFGHAWKMWQNMNAAGSVIPGARGIDPALNTASEALRWENRMRQQVYGPLGPNNAPRNVH